MSEKPMSFEELLVREVQHTPAEYWPNLLQLVRLFRETVTLNPAAQSFHQGWQETMSGQTRKYRHIRSDLDPLLTDLQEGNTPGDQVSGSGYAIFKVRVKNRDAQRGKRGVSGH